MSDVKDVVPFVDKEYPTLAEPRGRLLTAFAHREMARCGFCCVTWTHSEKRRFGIRGWT